VIRSCFCHGLLPYDQQFALSLLKKSLDIGRGGRHLSVLGLCQRHSSELLRGALKSRLERMDPSRPRCVSRRKNLRRWQSRFKLLFFPDRKMAAIQFPRFWSVVRTTPEKEKSKPNIASLSLIQNGDSNMLLCSICVHAPSRLPRPSCPRSGRQSPAALLIESPGRQRPNYRFSIARMVSKAYAVFNACAKVREERKALPRSVRRPHLAAIANLAQLDVSMQYLERENPARHWTLVCNRL